MMWFGLMVLATTSLVAAQQQTTCECYAYFVCENLTWHDDVECQNYNEVCCEIDPIPTVTVTPIDSRIPSGRNSSDLACGVRKTLPGFIWKVQPAPGVEDSTQIGEFPWMTAIMRNTSRGQKFLGGGSVIYPNIILTTAHTIHNIPASELLVNTGVWNSTDISEIPKHQDRKVVQTVLHPGFSKVRVANDVALLVLDNELTITDYVAPICLPSSSNLINESSCIAIGWGADKYGKYNAEILKKVVLPLVDFDTCQNKIRASRLGSRFQLHDSFICAGDGYHGDTCVGDGGGPLMCATIDNPDQYVQVGITSWGVGCSDGVPGVYSSVKAAATWIEEQADIYEKTKP